MSSRQIQITTSDDPLSRLDKELAALMPADLGISRTRLSALIKDGQVHARDGQVLSDPKARVAPGVEIIIDLPAPKPIDAQPEDIPLVVVYEDDDLIVVDKPAGLVVHPGPGSETGTLVNALLHHCGDSLRGIGEALRPGIVHRIDKDTSGLLVVAKTDQALQGLAGQFAAHSVMREYVALTYGVPDAADPRLMGLREISHQGARFTGRSQVGRHPKDRKKMAVVTTGGKSAVTHFEVTERFGGKGARIACRLETGRTHQIRVHLAHIGHPLIGDPTYGRARVGFTFARQALHAAILGFEHPRTGETLEFRSEMPDDMAKLLADLRGDCRAANV